MEIAVGDIRIYKNNLRADVKAFRKNMPPGEKLAKDKKIMDRLFSLPEYQKAGMVVTYVSTGLEVDTRRLIEKALKQGKRVAVPKCVPGTRQMKFYMVKSLCDDLALGTFGVLEPLEERCEEVVSFGGSICIVPALLCDFRGYRLGYGGGYYDRFLAGYHHPKICVIYSENIKRRLNHGRFDVPVNTIVTDNFLRRVRR